MSNRAWLSSLIIAAALWGVGIGLLLVMAEISRTYNYVDIPQTGY